MPIFRHNDLGPVRVAAHRLIVRLAIQKQDHRALLLYKRRLGQIGQLRAFVLAGGGSAADLVRQQNRQIVRQPNIFQIVHDIFNRITPFGIAVAALARRPSTTKTNRAAGAYQASGPPL